MRPHITLALTSLFVASQIVNPLLAAPVTFSTRQAIQLYEPVLTLADINRDGHTDIVSTVFSTTSDQFVVNILLGTGKGTFTQGPIVDLGAGFTPTAIATGDFNGDGRLDIAVLSSTNNNIQSLSILTQQATGFTTTPIQIPEVTSGTQNIGVADLNGDQLPDLIIPTSAGTLLFLSKGGGVFGAPILASSAPSTFVIVADLNGDKNLDLVVTNEPYCCYANSVSILLGDGHGGFDSPLTQPAFSGVSSRVAIGDFNKDGKPDIAAVTQSNEGEVEIALGNGDGTFASPNSFSLPSQAGQPSAVVASDLNGDGTADLLVLAASYTSTSIVGFLNEGKGTFGPANIYPVQAGANVVVVGNLNADTYPDALVYQAGAGQVISLLFNTGHGSFMDGEVISTSAPLSYLVAGDFNGDGIPDLVGLNGSSGLTVYLNNGNNKNLFSPFASLPYYTGPILSGDFNNDGHEDLVVFNNSSGETLLGNGAGTFIQAPATFSTIYQVYGATTADMNGDGILDIVTNVPSINLGNGDGTFQAPYVPFFNYCSSAPVVAVADFNKDGKPDVISTCDGSIQIYLGNGDGTVQPGGLIEYQPSLLSLAVGDFNNDGFPDVAFTSNPNFYLPGSTGVTILLGQGNGSFTQGVTIPVPTGLGGQLVAGEYDGNGALDLAILDTSDSAFSILRGNGDGTFQLPEVFGTATAPGCIVSGRFRSGTMPGEQDLVFCAGPGIAVDLNTTK